MRNIYLIDWIKLGKEHLLIALRRTLIMHVLNSALFEVRLLHNIFLERGEDWLYKQRHTSQVVHIEKVLNDQFDSVERRIYINNVTFDSYNYLYPDGEDPHFLQEEGADPDKPMYLLDANAGVLSPDATVYVPVGMRPSTETELQTFETKLRALIDYYKTYGVNYQIIYYE